jgi:hypothetical protein
MAHVVELDVNRYGFLYSPDESLSVRATVEHSWLEPFPTLDGEVEFAWERGTSRRQPDVFKHSQLRDFVCDTATHRILTDLVRTGLHVVARGRYGDREMVVLQVTTVFDVVDAARSNPAQYHRYAPGALEWPHIPADREPIVRGTFFRVPNDGLALTVLVADDVKDAIERAGLRGWTFVRAELVE